MRDYTKAVQGSLPTGISVILNLNYIYQLFPQSQKLKINFYNYMKS